ncbi:MAG: hypothetical protein WC804_16445 [Sphingomonas sp.]|uniref:hypothetical protein n=1 Tax=Sphingomonas sp. TaxID=28214 RepID=UPI00356273E5
MLTNDLSLRVFKTIAALCVVFVLLLSFFGLIVGGSMGAHPLERPTWFAAIVATPVIAISVFIWATLREHRQRPASLAAYLVVIAMPVVWFALTRS